jgi:hypothetical protein
MHPISKGASAALLWVKILFLMFPPITAIAVLAIMPATTVERTWRAEVEHDLQFGGIMGVGSPWITKVCKRMSEAWLVPFNDVSLHVEPAENTFIGGFNETAGNSISEWLETQVKRTAEFYLPIILTRSLYGLMVVIPGIAFLVMAFYLGQYEARNRLRVGYMPRPHRYRLFRDFAVAAGALWVESWLIPIRFPSPLIALFFMGACIYFTYTSRAASIET